MQKVKTYIPISMNSNGLDELYPLYIEELKAAKASRVYFCGTGLSNAPAEEQEKIAERFGKLARIFENAGFEVAAWVEGTLGHGGPVTDKKDSEFTYAENLDGKINAGSLCPLDENYIAHFRNYIKMLVKNGAKTIMLDDDFRMNLKSGAPFCFCKNHLKLMSEYLGREVSKEDFRNIFDGKPSEERNAYMYAQGEGLKRIARELREAVDEIDPTVRLGHCAVLTTWDVEGVDSITLAKIFAGNTRPFVRLIGAAYWAHLRVFGSKNLSAVIQYERMQAHWCKEHDIEIFAEGDVYPRPRYVVPSAYLELMDLAIRASGGFEGHLKYMSNYVERFDHNRGYFDRHIANEGNRTWIEEHFEGKETLGLRIHAPMNTLKFSENSRKALGGQIPPALKFTAYNAIPSKFSGDGLTVIWGDAAWTATEDDLKDGAILDGNAADILTRRGFDVGIEAYEGKSDVTDETFLDGINDTTGLTGAKAHIFTAKPSAEILSMLKATGRADKTVGSYIYEDGAGRKYLVYALDGDHVGENISFFDFTGITGNYRKKQLFETLKKFGVNLPECRTDAPFLYMIAKQDEKSLSVFLMNAFEDSVMAPEIRIGEGFSEIQVCNGEGRIEGDKVILSDIHPFGFAAFTVYKK